MNPYIMNVIISELNFWIVILDEFKFVFRVASYVAY